MKYLRSLESFKSLKYEHTKKPHLKPINEAMENDITWGGSLIGRLINSTIRVVNIRYKATKINGLLEQLKNQLEILLVEQSSLAERENLRLLRAKLLLEEIYKVVMSEKTVEEKLRILLSLSDFQRRQSGTGTLQTSSYKYSAYGKIFEAAEDEDRGEDQDKAEEEDNRDTKDDGLIDIVIRDVESCDIEKKDVLLKKLKDFKAELMKVDEEEKKEEEKKEEEPKEKSDKFKLYSETRKFLEGYLDIIRQIQNNSVKQQSTYKKGEVVMWKQLSGAEKGELVFGKVMEDTKEDSEDVRVRKQGKGGDFRLPLKHVLALTYFDEDYYKAMREKTPKEIKAKYIKAKIGFWTFYNKKDSAKQKFYEDEKARLFDLLPKEAQSEFADLESEETSTKKPQVGATTEPKKTNQLATSDSSSNLPARQNASFFLDREDFSLILEEANVVIKTKAQIGAWGFIVDRYTQMKQKNASGLKSHVTQISELLEGKPSGNEARQKIIQLGQLLVKLLSSKYKPISIDTLRNFTKQTTTELVKTSYAYGGNFDNLILEANLSDEELADIICELSVPILSLEQDMDLAGSFIDSNKEGVSKSILKMISSFDVMKESAKKLSPSESRLFLSYTEFKLIREARESDEGDLDDVQGEPDEGGFEEDENETTKETEEESQEEKTEPTRDFVQIAWFKFFEEGEEKEWVVNVEEIKKPIGPEKEKIEINVEPGNVEDPKLDPIIRIMNIFGQAYRLYATDFIPSGRPEGRVSQRTLREYEYMGKGEASVGRGGRGDDYMLPGYGPWAARKVFDKWEDGVNSILEDKWYRKVLANIFYVSQAEKTTNTRQIEQSPEKSSGITLLRFITELLTFQGTFKEAKRTLMLKYFNADIKETTDELKNKGLGPKVSKDDIEKPDEPVFVKIGNYNNNKGTNPEVTGTKVKVGYFYRIKMKVDGVEKFYLLWTSLKTTGTRGYVVFRAQETAANVATEESFISVRFSEPNFKYKKSKLVPPLKNVPSKDIFLIAIKADDLRKFKPSSSLDIHIWRNIDDIRQTESNYQFKAGAEIKAEFEIMVVSELNTNNQAVFKPVEIDWNPTYKATKDSAIKDNEKQEIQNKISARP